MIRDIAVQDIIVGTNLEEVNSGFYTGSHRNSIKSLGRVLASTLVTKVDLFIISFLCIIGKSENVYYFSYPYVRNNLYGKTAFTGSASNIIL